MNSEISLESLKDWKVILSVGSAFVLSGYVVRYLKNRKYKLPKGPFLFLLNPERLHEEAREFHKKYGKTILLSYPNMPFVVISDWKLAKFIFDHRQDFPQPQWVRDGFNFRSGMTMFTSEGELWKHKRHALEPLFHPKLLKQKFLSVNKKLDILLKLFEDIASSPNETERKVNCIPLLHRLTTDAIGEVAFGVDFKTLEEPEKIYYDQSGKNKGTILAIFEEIKKAFGVRFLTPHWMWNLPLPVFTQELKNMSILKTIFRKAIEEHAKILEDEIKDEYHGDDLISLLLSTNRFPDPKKHLYTEDDMLGESFSLFGAGQDTTATEAALAFSCLVENPEIQEKAWEEIKSIAEANGGDPRTYKPTFEDLSKMRYIENIVKEALRLHPVAPFLVRECSQDTQVGDYYLPKGMTVMLNVYEIHRDTQYFRDPEKVIPERWNEMEANSPNLLTFGFGSRICFGRKFAMIELKTLLFRLLQQFKLEFQEKASVINIATLAFTNNSFIVKLKKRD